MKMKNVIGNEIASVLLASEEHSSYFKVTGPKNTTKIIDVPPDVMHRIFRIGQAYNLKKLRYLESKSTLVIGMSEMQEFVKNLNKLLPIINDDEIHKYVNQLLIALNLGGTSLNKCVAVKTSDYYENRT